MSLTFLPGRYPRLILTCLGKWGCPSHPSSLHWLTADALGPECASPLSQQLHSEVEKPLMNFRENFKKDMKKCDHHIADLRKQLASRYASVEKVRGPGRWARAGGWGTAWKRGDWEASSGSICQG